MSAVENNPAQGRFGLAIDCSAEIASALSPLFYAHPDMAPGATAEIPNDHKERAECTAMTVRWYAGHQDWPLDYLEVVDHAKKQFAGTSKLVEERSCLM